MRSFYQLFNRAGLHPGTFFLQWFEETIKTKVAAPYEAYFGRPYTGYLTLGELRALVEHSGYGFKHLYVTGTVINDPSRENPSVVFSSEDQSMDNFIVSDCVRISMSIPLVFRPHEIHIKVGDGRTKNPDSQWKGRLFVDGGLFRNYPLDIFDKVQFQRERLSGAADFTVQNMRTLGFSLYDKAEHEQLQQEAKKLESLDDLKTVMKAMFSLFYNNENTRQQAGDKHRTIRIDTVQVSTVDFNLAEERKQALVYSGRQAVINYLKDRYDHIVNIEPVDSDPSKLFPGSGEVESQVPVQEMTGFGVGAMEIRADVIDEFIDEDSIQAKTINEPLKEVESPPLQQSVGHRLAPSWSFGTLPALWRVVEHFSKRETSFSSSGDNRGNKPFVEAPLLQPIFFDDGESGYRGEATTHLNAIEDIKEKGVTIDIDLAEDDEIYFDAQEEAGMVSIERLEAASSTGLVVKNSRELSVFDAARSLIIKSHPTGKGQSNFFPLLFDNGRWDSVSTTHPQTGQPIFTYRVYKDDQEVGSARFYQHPLLCRSEAKDRHNVLELTGVLSNMDIRPEQIEEICASLPPTHWEELSISAQRAACHGLYRGLSEVVGYACHRGGYADMVVQMARHSVYYGLYATSRFVQYATAAEETDSWERTLASFQQAVMETSLLAGFNLGLELAKRVLQRGGEALAEAGYSRTGKAVQDVAQTLPYATFLYQARSESVSSSLVALAAGQASHMAVRHCGCAAVDGLSSRAAPPAPQISLPSREEGCTGERAPTHMVLSSSVRYRQK